jgi:hypothetical protein
MLSFVPVAFDLYRPLKRRLRWALQCLVAFADWQGRCFPSLRFFAKFAGISKSAAGRDLAELVRTGCATRTRQPGGFYHYQIDKRFLPRAAKEGVSQNRQAGCPKLGTKEYQSKNKGSARTRAMPRDDFGVAPEDWPSRLRVWKRDGHWNRQGMWGPKPGEAGCRVPPELLAM